MTEPALREPEQIRQDCARKLAPIETSGMFSAILGCLLGKDWAEPRIEQLIVTDKCLLARTEGEATHKLFLGAEDDLIRNVHGIANTARLDGDEVGYPLVRTHSLLSNLHKIMGQTPLVMFYPGKYDQMTLRLFGKLSLSSTLETVAGKTKRQEHYYRAFKLVP